MNTPLTVLPVVEYCAQHDFVLHGLSDVYIPFEGWRQNRLYPNIHERSDDNLTWLLNFWAEKYPGAGLRFSFNFTRPDGMPDFKDFEKYELQVGEPQPTASVESSPLTTLTGMPVGLDYDASRLLAYSRSPFHLGQS